MKRVVLSCTLGVVGLLILANIAAACTFECVWVTDTCRRCLDIGVYNAQTCKNTVGPCGCFYTRNLCDPVTFAQSVGVTPSEEAATCSTLPKDADLASALIFAAE